MLRVVPKRPVRLVRLYLAVSRFLGSPYLWTVVLVLSGLAVLAAVEYYANTEVVERYGPNFVAEIGGIVVMLLFVDWIVRRQNRRQIEPARRVAVQKLVGAFSQVVDLLALMIKASSRPQAHPPTTVDALMDEWLREVPRLNFLALAPPSPRHTERGEVNWGVYLADAFKEADNRLASVMDVHAQAVGGELFMAVELLRADMVFSYLRDGISIVEGRLPHPDREPFLPLSAAQSGPALVRFGESVKRLATALEHAIGYGAGLEIDATIWRRDVAAPWGVARYAGAMHPRLTRSVILAPGRLPRAGPEYAGQIRPG